jgi:UDP-4-amino-4,6-dideoxy-N-acetyl-beta-L-altrosamine transaminase
MIRIPYARQDISDADVAAVVDALRAPFLTQGPLVGRFEEELARTVGARHAVAYNSGTAALHGAYAAAGVGPGSTVVTSPITFVATANASLYLGGDARFVDIDPRTLLLDPGELTRVDAPRDSVVVPVHFGGQVAEMERISELARERGWMVVEDAAHALGAMYRTRDGASHRVGACAHSDMCCFSFHPVKHITTCEGGAVTTNDDRLYQRLVRFRTHGITRNRAEMSGDDGDWYYEQHELGFNYRLPDVQCALGLSQLGRLPEFVRRRRQIAASYDAAFADSQDIGTQSEPDWSTGSYHLYVARVPSRRRRAIFDRLRQQGIGVNVHYIPVYRQPFYRARGFDGFSLPHAERYYAEAVSLPMFPALTDADATEVQEAVHDAVRNG